MAPTFYEFFCGGGMARVGLGDGWRCLLANDIDPQKAQSYRENFGSDSLLVRDVAALRVDDLPGAADLAWASFPCQDLSLAGERRGMGGARDAERSRSGAFWPFWRLMRALAADGRGPKIIALENVTGLLTANRGEDFRTLASVLVEGGYRFGALVIDAAAFVPQSRPRLFIVALRADLPPPPQLIAETPRTAFASTALIAATAALPEPIRRSCVWWRLPEPRANVAPLAALLEPSPRDAPLRPPAQTLAMVEAMAEPHRKKLEAAATSGTKAVGAAYKRTRRLADGARVVRTEVRFDGLAGCLRTPAGGSSRQSLLIVDQGEVSSRLVSAREAARLMGLPEDYRLPTRYSAAYHLLGDGVCPPVVRHLRVHLFEPLLALRSQTPPKGAEAQERSPRAA